MSTEDWAARMTVTVYAHLHGETSLAYRLTREAGRVLIEVTGNNSADLVLFTDRADLARLIATATAALAALDTTRTEQGTAAPAA